MKKNDWMMPLLAGILCCSVIPANAAPKSGLSDTSNKKVGILAQRLAGNARADRQIIAVEAAEKPTVAAPGDQERVQAYYRQGQEKIEKKEYEDAIAAFNKALDLDPAYADAYAARGELYARFGHRSSLYFSHYIESKIANECLDLIFPPKEPKYLGSRAMQKLQKENAKKEKQNQDRQRQEWKRLSLMVTAYYKNALSDDEKYLALRPESTEAERIYIQRGEVYYHLGKQAAKIVQVLSDENLNLRYLSLVKQANQKQQHVKQEEIEVKLRETMPKIAENYQKALDDYNEVLKRNPASALAYAQRGDTYYAWGRYRLAAAGAPSGYWTMRFEKRPLPQKMPHVDLTYYQSAIADYQKALSLSSANARVLLEIGKVYKNSYDFAQALHYADLALEVPELYERALYERAGIYSSLGRNSERLKDIALLQKKNPQNYLPLEMGMRVDRFKNAQEIILEATEKLVEEPENAALYQSRGDQFFSCGIYPLAIADYTRAIALGIRQSDIYWKRGESYRQMRQWKKALADYDQLESLGLASLAQSDEDAARKKAEYEDKKPWLNKVGEYQYLLPDEAREVQFYVRRSGVREILGEYEAAGRDYTQAIVRRPEVAALYYRRYAFNVRLGLYHLAIADLLQVIRLDPAAHWYNVMGSIYAHRLKDDEKALECLNRGMEVEAFAGEYLSRGLIYDRMGDEERARADFEKVDLKPYPKLRDKIPKKYLMDNEVHAK